MLPPWLVEATKATRFGACEPGPGLMKPGLRCPVLVGDFVRTTASAG
ncbi:hypothetical protein I547_7441 [Mycobacterium kansasii 824]|uniref:Uncharacterized protein n=1 Tax=Mycobacterium kansasii TaxID=1768 RepID=A0A1V3XE60_MYCKA|nr:hypothetical protein I547_7441 [Mycobacterium kansasii 824]OOK66800.1 hypothetical protein BZL30_8457 [Mycobacterium kansasii]OOK77462.1 hypothetical protein BZL29_3046 [Mycobacterium kansasii]